jgi:hypothetical protein
MVIEMKKKFHKYFMESYLTNCIAVVFDPRFKMEHVVFRLKQYFGVVHASKHILEVKLAIKALLIEYAAEFQDNVDVLSQEQNSQEDSRSSRGSSRSCRQAKVGRRIRGRPQRADQ